MKFKLNKVHFKKVFLAFNFLIVSSLSSTINISEVHALATLYEYKTNEVLTKGVTYESVRQVTDEGLRDVHILRVPIGDPNISIGAAESVKEQGFKEPVKTLLTDNGAIAGVNADFFGLAGTYSNSFGATFKDGKLVSVGTGLNTESNEYATLFINKENNPFILYLKTEIDFLNNGVENIEINSINKIKDMSAPIVVNRQAMDSTNLLDARFGGLLKVVVDDNMITYVSKKGETVEVPENGYVVVIGNDMEDQYHYSQIFAVGQTAEIKLRSVVDFDKIQTAISGGARILLDGETSHDADTVAKGRHPRTAIGISEDKTQLILMVVDGRTHSIGATHDELAELLKRYGAYNAMHLDGGGSSTMAVKSTNDTEMQIVNTLSEGSQRKVINALGIYNKAPVGNISKLVIKSPDNKIFLNSPARIQIYGIDEYYNKIEIPRNEVLVNSNDPDGQWANDLYYAGKTGSINIIAAYGDLAAEENFQSNILIELSPTIKTIKGTAGDTVNLRFTGIDADGEQAAINSGISYVIEPNTLGTIENNVFTAATGKGYIKASVGEVSTYIDVYLGGKDTHLHSFEGDLDAEFVGYPEANVTGAVSYSSVEKAEGSKSAEMSYTFTPMEGTQAAYFTFKEPFKIPGNPIALKLSVWGNNSKLWLRGRIKDADGREHYIDFAKSVDWDGFKTLQAKIPGEVKYPITLERIYLASITTSEIIRGNIFFDNLLGIYPLDETKVPLPESPKFSDLLRVSLKTAPDNGSFDITLLGDMIFKDDRKPENYKSTQNKALAEFKKNSKRGLYAGETDIPVEAGDPIYQWNTTYYMHSQDNVGIIQMTAARGGFMNTQPWQWAQFSEDITNSGKDHIIIMLDKNPLSFSQPKEFTLFQDALLKFKETGKTIFVVSTDGLKSTSTIKSGIRYINVGGLWNADGSINNDFKILRFRVAGNSIFYDLQSLEN